MRPAFSVIFLTTLIGAAQGLFLVLCAAAFAAGLTGAVASPPDALRVSGGLVALVLLVAGLAASFFHLGHPQRAWRTATQWRSSWLSREVIVLPLFMLLVALYAAAHHPAGAALRPWATWIAVLGVLAGVALFVCTGMIYACLRFLQEWASPLTLLNFTLLGLASGCTLAAALAAFQSPELAATLARWAIGLTLIGFGTRALALARNLRLRPISTLATAIGIKHPRIVQKAAGFLGGSFNTREFFHGRTRAALRTVRAFFLLAGFALPVLLLAAGIASGSPVWLVAAVLVQFAGLIAERWYFFADANHPQNLYYSAIA